MAEKVASINLLPRKSESFANQLLNWTLTIGRLLIILTEMVALGTFLYRFSLDMENVDLHDKIKGESFIVANFKSSEDHFRDIQDRLATIKRYNSVNTTTPTIFTDISNLGKGNITFQDLTVNAHDIKIQAQSPSSDALSRFIAGLQTYPAITSVSIDKVSDSASSAQITVSITATLKKQAFADPDQQNTRELESPTSLGNQ